MIDVASFMIEKHFDDLNNTAFAVILNWDGSQVNHYVRNADGCISIPLEFPPVALEFSQDQVNQWCADFNKFHLSRAMDYIGHEQQRVRGFRDRLHSDPAHTVRP